MLESGADSAVNRLPVAAFARLFFVIACHEGS